MTFFTLVTLLAPQIALADPLTGANSDVGIFWYYNMGSYNDDTTDANDADSAGDVSWPQQETKGFYVGHTTLQFNTVYVDVSTALTGLQQGYDLLIEYWNGATWEDLTLTAQTQPFDTTGVNNFAFTAPGDWATKDVNGTTAYYIRGEGGGLSNVPDGGGYIGAAVSQISLITESGETVPEFSDYLYMITLAAGGWYVFTRMKKFQLGGGNGGMAV